MKWFRLFLLNIFILLLLTGIAFSQVDLASILPIYPDSNVSTLSRDNGDRLAVATSDDPKAVMIFFRKMLANDGWEVSSGSVLQNDPIIVFARNGHRLTMEADTASGATPRIIFSLTE